MTTSNQPPQIEAVEHMDPQWMLRIKGTEFKIIAITSQGDDEANAKRLAHCWNNHDRLLAACAALVRFVEMHGDADAKDYSAVCLDGRAAIKEAEQQHAPRLAEEDDDG